MKTDLRGILATETRSFDKRPWIRKLRITFYYGDGENTEALKQIEAALECQHLQKLHITLTGDPKMFRCEYAVGVRITTIAEVCNQIRARTGQGFSMASRKMFHELTIETSLCSGKSRTMR